jgi:hypothetical protein
MENLVARIGDDFAVLQYGIDARLFVRFLRVGRSDLKSPHERFARLSGLVGEPQSGL